MLAAAIGLTLIAQAPFRICIDPGHPSELNDAFHLTNGISENWVNWQVSLLLKKELEKIGGFSIKFTKTAEKELVKNRRRAEIANEFGAQLLLRIHADAGPGSGFTIYYPKQKGTTQGTTGPSEEVIRRSGIAATAFHEALATSLKGILKDNGIKGDILSNIGSKQGALTGSIFSKCPVMMVEMCFLTNKKDAAWIKEPQNRTVMAKALAAGCVAVRKATPSG
ncbi:MAG: N-acetylmuramoyl-L-alanine amidase [Fimbriimonadales bacterium]